MQLHPDIINLLNLMRKLEHFLVACGETFWSLHITKAADCVENSDAQGLTKFLSLFGGMGSFNDFVLDQEADNEKLKVLRSRAWSHAALLNSEEQLAVSGDANARPDMPYRETVGPFP